MGRHPKIFPVHTVPYETRFSPAGFFSDDQLLTEDTQCFVRFQICCSKLQVPPFKKGTINIWAGSSELFLSWVGEDTCMFSFAVSVRV